MKKVNMSGKDYMNIIGATLAFIALVATIVSIYVAGHKAESTAEETATNVEEVIPMTFVKAPVVQEWHFKHCTPTNKDCGRLE